MEGGRVLLNAVKENRIEPRLADTASGHGRDDLVNRAVPEPGGRDAAPIGDIAGTGLLAINGTAGA